MKKTLALLLSLTFAAGVSAQSNTAYFMEGSTLRSQLNPALAPQRGYFNIPGVGGINVSTSGNIALGDVLFPRNGKLVTLLDSSVSSADALAGLNAENYLGVETRVNILGFGAYTKNRRNFWSFDLNLRTASDVDLPRSLFEFLKTGREGVVRNVGVSTDAYLEAGFSYSFPLLNDKLYLGARAKFLVGMARARLNYDRMDIRLDENRWSVDASGTLDLTANGAASDEISCDENGTYTLGDLSPKPYKPAGYGFAVDLGATYDILPELQVSVAVTDLGFISWNKKYNSTGRSVKSLEFTGVQIENGHTAEQPDFDMNLLEFTPAAAQGATKSLNASLNAGVEYKVWREKIGIGLLYTARFWEFKTRHSLTGSVNFQPVVHADGQLHGHRQPGRRRGAGDEPLPRVDQLLRGHRPADDETHAAVGSRPEERRTPHARTGHPHRPPRHPVAPRGVGADTTGKPTRQAEPGGQCRHGRQTDMTSRAGSSPKGTSGSLCCFHTGGSDRRQEARTTLTAVSAAHPKSPCRGCNLPIIAPLHVAERESFPIFVL